MSFKRDKQEKFKSLLCQCSLMAGHCPYEESCLFLHDPRVLVDSKPPLSGGSSCKTRTSPLKTTRDAFYWPDQQVNLEIQQRYEIPEKFSRSTVAQGYSPQSAHNRGIFSLWSHFIQMLVDPSSVENSDTKNSFLPDRSRLPVFVRLASHQGEYMHPDKFRLEKEAETPKFLEWKATHNQCCQSGKKIAIHPRGCTERASC
jgi:hypothetical protein